MYSFVDDFPFISCVPYIFKLLCYFTWWDTRKCELCFVQDKFLATLNMFWFVVSKLPTSQPRHTLELISSLSKLIDNCVVFTRTSQYKVRICFVVICQSTISVMIHQINQNMQIKETENTADSQRTPFNGNGNITNYSHQYYTATNNLMGSCLLKQC
jgi:hypothetical protein